MDLYIRHALALCISGRAVIDSQSTRKWVALVSTMKDIGRIEPAEWTTLGERVGRRG